MKRWEKRVQNQAAKQLDERLADVEPLTAADLNVIRMALQTHERVMIERESWDAAELARDALAKIERNMKKD